ncbi:MAG: hypothetical protein AB7O64_17815 [Methylibium sp.]
MAWNYDDDPYPAPVIFQTFLISAVTGACSGAAITLLVLRIGGWL